MLDKQFQAIYIDTGCLYSNHELYLHNKVHKIRRERKVLQEQLKEIQKEVYKIDDGFNFDTYTSSDKDIGLENIIPLYRLEKQHRKIHKYYTHKSQEITRLKNELSTLLHNKVEQNILTNGKDHIRELRVDSIYEDYPKNTVIKRKLIISIFDSSLSRTLGFQENVLTFDYIVMKIYFFDLFKDALKYGFVFNGEKYVYYSSSAGQIRTKRGVFLKESLYLQHIKTIMCGLTVDSINAKGGLNSNKYLAYLALANSATDVWKEFDIDKSIVIDDFETDVYGEFDFVDDVTYTVTRKTGSIPIAHTDGCGMILPEAFGVEQKNRMIRLPWIKGLLGVFDYKRFIYVNHADHVIKDIYGTEHNIIEEDIQVIFTKSQFKLWKYYDNWDDYKSKYKQYNCSAGITNEEEDKIKNALINYQMLQSLTDITDDEIKAIAHASIQSLLGLCSSVQSVKNAFEVTPYNTNKTAFQKSIELYPTLLNDNYTKLHLKEIKDSLIKKYRSGKLQIDGKYTFLLPDFYACCEYWFQHIENPNGLLKDGQVFCWLFRKYKKLDCLRSPHLYMEHAVRQNCADESCWMGADEIRQWFTTSALYTSCHDMISRILQFDVDGDKSLVVADETVISVAERNQQKFDIVPLYYEMKKAPPHILNSDNIYNGLITAFTTGNIGIYSNNISKIWNTNTFVNGTLEEQTELIHLIKLLCMENNFTIDTAKTLYKPVRPKEINNKIKKYTVQKLPAFFEFAKDKSKDQIVERNNSFVNKLYKIIPNTKIDFRKLNLGKLDYTLMMTNPDIQFDVKFDENGKLIESLTDPLILKYHEISVKQNFQLNSIMNEKIDTYEVRSNAQLRQDLKYKIASQKIRDELSQFGYSNIEVADILVKYLYGIKNNKRKTILWLCYGDIIYNALCAKLINQVKEVQCEVCGKWFTVNKYASKVCRCSDCQREYRKVYKREFMRANN